MTKYGGSLNTMTEIKLFEERSPSVSWKETKNIPMCSPGNLGENYKLFPTILQKFGVSL